MKKLLVIMMCIAIAVLTGCSKPQPQPPAPKPSEQTDTAHLTAEDKGLKLSVTREVRNMTKMIPSSKEGYDVISVLVKVENNSKDNIPVSPDFVTLKTTDGIDYKYSPSLTEGGPVGRSAFTKRSIPPDYQGGGLLIFELKTGSMVQSLTYQDDKNHKMTIKFPSNTKTNV